MNIIGLDIGGTKCAVSVPEGADRVREVVRAAGRAGGVRGSGRGGGGGGGGWRAAAGRPGTPPPPQPDDDEVPRDLSTAAAPSEPRPTPARAVDFACVAAAPPAVAFVTFSAAVSLLV